MKLKLAIMKHQWSKIIVFVLATATLPFLLSAAITTNNPTDSSAPSGNVVSFDKLISPFAGLTAPINLGSIIDNDTDNLAQVSLTDKNKVNTLIALRGKGLSFTVSGSSGLLNYLAAQTAPIVLSKKVTGTTNVAKQFLTDYGKLFGLTNVNQLAKPTVSRDKVGYTHLRYQYVYKNIPVWGAMMLVHLNKTNAVVAVSGKIIPGINISTKPALSVAKIKAAAIKIGRTQFQMTKPTAGAPKLYIYNKKYLNDKNANKNYLAYEVAVDDKNNGAKKQTLIINAKTGQLIDSFAGVEFSLDRQVYNCHNTKSDCRDNSPSHGSLRGRFEGDSEVDSDIVNWDYENFEVPYNYYKEEFAIDGANNYGGIVDITTSFKEKTPVYTLQVRDKEGYVAYYNRNRGIVLQDNLADYTKNDYYRDTVIYHEYTHAVVDLQGPEKFPYQGESAIIKEAYADIFAVYIYKFYQNNNNIIKYTEAKNPLSFQPTTHYDSNFLCSVNDKDKYNNATVLRHLAYLLGEGGTLNGCKIEAVGPEITAQLLYFAMDKYFPDNPNFQDLYNAVNSVCKGTFDSETCDKVDYAMRVAELDHPGICNDPGKLADDGPHCGADGTREKSDKYYCDKYAFNCDSADVISEITRKIIKVNCGKCANSTDVCINNRCVACQSWTDKQMCNSKGYECGQFGAYDNCNKYRNYQCGLCRFGLMCKNFKCVRPPGIKGDGGQYDESGKSVANGGYYRHITIGNSTLFKDNFNGGTQINTPAIQTAYQKYCWQNNNGQCLQFGGLYQWHTAMGLPQRCDREDCTDLIKPLNHQGICPAGFHVPSDGEWSQLEDTLKLPDQSCNSNRYNTYDCYNAGAAMRLAGDNDFTAKIFNGIHDQQIITTANFLSATYVGSFNPQSIYSRSLKLSTYGDPNDKKAPPSTQSDQATKVGRMATGKNYLFALRCFADCQLQDGVWSDWKPIGGCGETKPNIQKQYRSCEKRECGGQACEGDAVREIPCDPDKSCGGLVKAEGGPRDKYGRDNRAKYYDGASSVPSDFKGGGYYGTVQVGEDCWLADNLNIGTKVISDKQRSSAGNGLEKWCYKNDAKQCEVFGGLYSWMEATGVYVDYTKDKKYWYDPPTPYGSEWLKGICPAGWKIPNNGEWQKFIAAGKDSVAVGPNLLKTPIRLDTGLTNIDSAMAWSSQGFVANDMTNVSGSIYDENNKYSSNSGSQAMIYGGFGGFSNVWYQYYLSARKGFEGLPVRCIQSCEPINGGFSDWQADGECGQYEAYMQRYTRTCNDPEPKCGGKTCEGLTVKEERCQESPNCGVVPYEGGPYDASGQARNQGGYYRTVLIQGTNAQGVAIDQCWLRDNLNVGQLVGVADQRNDSITEKYCRYYYNNRFSYEQAQAICQEFGGLYQWAEAMKLPAKCLDAGSYGICAVKQNHRGICPAGWHIPSDEEWRQLELYYSSVAGNLITCEAERISAQDKGMSDDEWAQTNCAKAGYKLRDKGMSGFDAMTEAFIKAGDGFRSRYHDLYYRSKGQDYRMGGYPILPEDEITAFWTTKAPTLRTVIRIDDGVSKITIDDSQALNRFLIGNYNNGLYRDLRSKRDGLSVRCIKDPCIVVDPNDPNYLVTTHAGQSGVGFGVYNPSGLPYCEVTPAPNTTNQPGAGLNQSQTALGSQGQTMSETEQIKYLQNLVSQSVKTRSYTDQELSFISSPQTFLKQYGFVQAEKLLLQANLGAQ